LSDKGTQTRQDRVEPKGGTVIADRYQVDRLIARGGMAAVYLAHHVKLNRPLALKILSHPPYAEDPQSFEDRFRLEAETLASLDHPNIVILHDFGETTDGRFFLAMEYVEGPRLSDLLRDGPLPVDRAVGLILQVCAALRYAHKHGVVHRDLKPSNLLIRTKDQTEEQLKVVDFGLVKLTETDQSITRAGLILGSPHCMAPEQIKGLPVDHRTDLYATGILLYRTLTGQYPFHGPNSAATMIAHLNQAIPTFYSVAPDLIVPAGLEEVVRRCLQKKPDDRYDSMQSLMNDLAQTMNIPAEQYKSVSQTHSTIQKRLPTRTENGRWLFAGAAGATALMSVLVAAVLLALWLARSPAGAVTSRFEGSADSVVAVTPPPAVVVEAAPLGVPGTSAVPVEGTVLASEEVAIAPPIAAESPPRTSSTKARTRSAVTQAAQPPAPEVPPEPAPVEKPTAPGYLGLPEDL
jgi:serine/threonine protein kinase